MFCFFSHTTQHINEGGATVDWVEHEKESDNTIISAATTCEWKDHRTNIIDTLGHVDITLEVQGSLRVLDGFVAIFDSVAGVELQSETVWRQVDKYGVPRMCFLNKMELHGHHHQAAWGLLRIKHFRAANDTMTWCRCWSVPMPSVQGAAGGCVSRIIARTSSYITFLAVASSVSLGSQKEIIYGKLLPTRKTDEYGLCLFITAIKQTSLLACSLWQQ